jgi:hypothetical protein
MAHPTRFERVTFAFGGQGLRERRASPQISSRSIGELFCFLRYSGFSYSRAAKTSTALHSTRRTQDLCVIFGIVVQIIRLTVGFAAWQLFGLSTYWTQQLVACFRSKIGSGTARWRRYQPRSVGHSVQAWESTDRFARAEVALGIISKRHLFKGTFGFEMHLML